MDEKIIDGIDRVTFDDGLRRFAADLENCDYP
jgi:hypothetical protein